jgi:hypothetical protein
MDTDEHSRLVEAKLMRKRVDEDARLLSNRIHLLKQEELKAIKKIEETKKKALEIVENRNRNLREEQKREISRKNKQEQEELKFRMGHQQRETIRMIKRQANLFKIEQAMQEIKSIKISKQNNLKKTQFKRFEDISNKAALINKIKQQQHQAKLKREKFFEEKLEKTRADFLKKAEIENNYKKLKEEHLARLEQEEMELIQRLQNTQILQKSAYEDLETALSGQVV